MSKYPDDCFLSTADDGNEASDDIVKLDDNKSTSRHCGNCDGSGADLCSRFNEGNED